MLSMMKTHVGRLAIARRDFRLLLSSISAARCSYVLVSSSVRNCSRFCLSIPRMQCIVGLGQILLRNRIRVMHIPFRSRLSFSTMIKHQPTSESDTGSQYDRIDAICHLLSCIQGAHHRDWYLRIPLDFASVYPANCMIHIASILELFLC